MSLRDELAGAAPKMGATPYSIVCPAGWRRVPPSALIGDEAIKRARTSFQQAGRPELFLEYRSMLAQLSSGFAKRGVFEVYLAPLGGEDVPMPALLAVSPLIMPNGVTLDQTLARLARGAPVDRVEGASAPMYRMESRDRRDDLRVHNTNYVVPVPDDPGRRTLLFQYTVLDSGPDDDGFADALLAIGDVIMASFVWRAAE